MAAPATTNEFLDLIRKSGVADEKRFEAHLQKLRAAGTLPSEPGKLAGVLVRDGLLTHFQAEQIMMGKWRRFTIGKYKVLERLGSGGMGSVFLCEHKLMRRRVAVKVLPTAKAADPSSLERFYREARAVAALDHPNIVHAYDIDQDENLHFLVMEYVDGASLQEIVKKTGPMDVVRAAHYIRQSALGLEHAHCAGLVHRDIKPGNILVDRGGVVKVLDMGLARFFNDEDDILTKKYDENVLGTADYLAPEQALDSHGVDIRADIYSLGATFYFLLTGKTPFGEGTVAQKLIWHQTRQPRPLGTVRQGVPPALSAVIEKMMSKDREQRFQGPGAVAEALAPWTQTPIGPPPENEMPRLSLAATGVSPGDITLVTAASSAATPPGSAKAWQVPTKPPSNPPDHVSPLPAPKPRMAGSPMANVPAMQLTETVPALIPAEQPAPEEAPWENMASDTEDPTARVDTAPSSIRRTLQAKQTRTARAQESRRLWRIAALVAALALTALAIGAILFFKSQSGPTERHHLLVSSDRPNTYRSIARALGDAQAGDVIELLDDRDENVIVDPNRAPRAITIQAAANTEVIWRSARKDESIPLLRLDKAHHFVLKGKGITLDGTMDGRRRVKNLVTIQSYCPGLALEDLTCRGFGHSAVAIRNCSGEPKHPIRILNLHSITTAPEKPAAAIFFDAITTMTPPLNDYIEIGPGEYEGIDPKNAIRPRDNTVNDSHVKWPK